MKYMRAGALGRRLSQKVGLPPGTLVFTGEKMVDQVRIDVIDHSVTELSERTLADPEECRSFKDHLGVAWLNVNGLHDVELLRRIGDMFSIHPVVMEDILDTDQRPKVEYSDSYVLVVLKMLGHVPGGTGDEQLQ